MISYEEAKKKAMEVAENVGAVLDTAKESNSCYIFDDSQHKFEGWIPTVIVKETGESRNHWHYLQGMTEKDFKSIHNIEF